MMPTFQLQWSDKRCSSLNLGILKEMAEREEITTSLLNFGMLFTYLNGANKKMQSGNRKFREKLNWVTQVNLGHTY